MNNKLRDALLKANKSVWDKSRINKVTKEGLYEVWFTMVDDLPREEAYWIRYTLMCPQTKTKYSPDQELNSYLDSLGGDGMLWMGYFNAKDPSKNYMIKKAFPLSSVEGTKKDVIIKIDENEGKLEGIKGGFETKSGKKVSWDLQFSRFIEPLIVTPDIAKKLKFTNTIAKGTHPNTRISGSITIDGNKKEMKEVPGIHYHTYGDGYKVPWEWLSCHTFKGAPDAYLDLGYKVNKGTMEFFDGEKSITIWNQKTLKKLKIMKKIKRERSLNQLKFNLENENIALNGEISVPMNCLLAVEYKGPQGNSFFCYNSEIADCKLKVIKVDAEGKILEEKDYIAEKSVSFETVYDNPQQGVPYLPWEQEEL